MVAVAEQTTLAVQELLQRGVIDRDGYQRARAAALKTGDREEAILIKLGLATEDAIADAYASALGLPRADVARLTPFIPDQLDPSFLAHAGVALAEAADGGRVLVTADPTDEYAPRVVSRHLASFQVAVGTSREVERLLRAAGGGATPLAAPDGGHEASDIALLSEFSSDAPVIRYVTRTIEDAVDRGASDIHFSVGQTRPSTKFRCDGVLLDAAAPTLDMYPAVVARLKIMAGLDIAEQRRPQGSRIRTVVGGREIDLRVSILPTIGGESVVVRVLDRARSPAGLQDLGLEQTDRDRLQRLIESPNGLILVTGPTGSGKTTTIAAMLAEIASPERHLVSVEDPIEIRVQGVTQVQVEPALGLTFPAILRSVLRHDPDVVTIGEIRDGETAAIAINAALTGHLVLATLHTNSAASAPIRLTDMGVEPFLVAATLRGVVAQRLIRQSCGCCGPCEDCATCGGTGYSGRTALLEFLEISEPIRGAISAREPASSLEDMARVTGFVSLREAGNRMVERGVTTAAELSRSLGASS